MNILKGTESLCPECLNVIPASIFERDERVYLEKTCTVHGRFEELYWSDYGDYLYAQTYARDGIPLSNPHTEVNKGCPHDCGICPNHKSHTMLAIVDVTNRCNLTCPICFAHSGAQGYVYEPTMGEISQMFQTFLDNEPAWPPAIQLSGGEPTVREDLPDIIRLAFEMGFRHVEVNTNGIRIAEEPGYAQKLKDANLSTVYLQFDGVTANPYIQARGQDLFHTKTKALNNLKNAGFYNIVLVPTLVNGVNDHQIGDIIRFALSHKDVVGAVNFQPVAITGRIDKARRDQMRITIPDLIRLAEEQTSGLIKQSDWFPVPFGKPLSDLVSKLRGYRYVDFGAHPHCGMGTYMVIDDGPPRNMNRVFNVAEAASALASANEKMENGNDLAAKWEILMMAIRNLGAFRKFAWPTLRGDGPGMTKLHKNIVLISAMHFMDPYNFDLERVQRCVIHYATPDGRLIPFCTMNNIHRQRIQEKFAIGGAK